MAARVLQDAQDAQNHAFGLELSARHILEAAAEPNLNAHADYLEILLEECPDLRSEFSVIEPYTAEARVFRIPSDCNAEPIFNPACFRDRGVS